MEPLEQKRENFRRYLEEAGAIENLTKVLIKLYEEQDKPEDAIGYILKNLTDQIGAPQPEQVEVLQRELGDAHSQIVVLEKELTMIQGALRRSDSEAQLILNKGMDKVESTDCNPFLKKTLTQDLLSEFQVKKTKFNGTILDCIQAALKNCELQLEKSDEGSVHTDSDFNCGVYSCDGDSFQVFSGLFARLVQESQGNNSGDDWIHNHPELEPGSETTIANGNGTNTTNTTNSNSNSESPNGSASETERILDPENNFIISTRIRCARSFIGFPFNPIMKLYHYEHIKDNIKFAITNLSEELKGTFYNLEEMSEYQKKQLSEKHLMFKEHDKVLEAANALRFWPFFRGIFVNEEENLAVWCNEEDHMKVVSVENGGNLGACYDRVSSTMEKLSKEIKFEYDERLGFLTFSPSNVGTALQASVHIKLPKLSANDPKFQEIIEKYNFAVRKPSEDQPEILEILNRRKLGVTEAQLIKDFADGITELIDVEKTL